MALFGWLMRAASRAGDPLQHWRHDWEAAIAQPNQAAHGHLRERLATLAASADDVEVEQEMLDGLETLLTLMDQLARTGLPVIETTHRVVGAEVCHFTAPVSMPEDPAQPSGRLLLTGTRAIFIGGPKATAVPWHAAADIMRRDRDLVVIRADQQALYRFRCNTYSDALAAEFIARRLVASRRRTL